MKQCPEETAAASPSVKTMINEMEAEGPSESSSMYMFDSSDCPRNSCDASLHTVIHISSIKRVESLGDVEAPFTNHLSVTQGMHLGKDYTVGNPKKEEPNLKQKRRWQHLYQLGGFRSRILSGEVNARNMHSDPLSLKEEKERLRLGRRSSGSLMIHQENEGIDQISNRVVDCRDKLISGCTMPFQYDQSRIQSSSNFDKLFGQQYLKVKVAECEGVAGHDACDFTTTTLCKTLVASSSGKTSDAEVKLEPSSDQYSLHNIDRAGSLQPQVGISLREWLQLWVSQVEKSGRLYLFRKIVELVDIQHHEGFGLQDLRPSNFIFASPDIIKYIGSSVLVDSTILENQSMTHRKFLKTDMDVQSTSGVKRQKLHADRKWIKLQAGFMSSCDISNEAMLESYTYNSDLQGHGDTDVEMEKNWYSCQLEIEGRDLFSSNIYGLGVIFFELFYPFESSEERSATMLNLRQVVLPAKFLSKSPKEAGFCSWLLHPRPSSRPTTREILNSEAMYGTGEACLSNGVPSCYETYEDTDSEILLHFLNSIKEQKQKHVSGLLENIECIDADIKEVRRRHMTGVPSNPMNKDVDNGKSDLLLETCSGSEIFETRYAMANVLQKSLTKNISELGKVYFSMRSKLRVTEVDRTDKDLLSNRDCWYQFQIASKDLHMEGRTMDQAGTFFEGVCRFARYRQFEVCGNNRSGNLLSCTNLVCSLSFDRDEDYIAVAGVSKKIKIFEFGSLLTDSDDIEYSIVEMSNKSKLSCVCWNKYFKQYLASTDYDGVVQIWDVSSSQAFILYNEHQKRTWSVDFSLLDPAKFATGSDDCSVKLWCTTELQPLIDLNRIYDLEKMVTSQRNSTATIQNPANICCVQFSAFSSHMLAFGSADHKIYCYDIRHMKIPWCTLGGHGKTVSHVKFLDSETVVSASTDSTLKLWDLKKTSMQRLSLDACILTFSGHSNQKNFVGLSVLDGCIACGSETNEVYAYYRSFPVPIASHNFGSVDPVSGVDTDDSNGQFVTSVCWRRKSDMLVSANSSGRLKVLRLV